MLSLLQAVVERDQTIDQLTMMDEEDEEDDGAQEPPFAPEHGLGIQNVPAQFHEHDAMSSQVPSKTKRNGTKQNETK